MIFNYKMVNIKKLYRCIKVVLFSSSVILMLYILNRRFEKYKLSNIDSVKFGDRDMWYGNKHNNMVMQFYDKRRNWNTSILGSMLFKETYPERRLRENFFRILIWKHWAWLQQRHIYYYGFVKHDPLDGCSVKNCEFTGDDTLLNEVDAVVVHLQKGLLPERSRQNLRQRWIFLTDESPIHTYMLAKQPHKLTELVDLFNWSMTYRIDADIPVPYGRIIPLQESRFEGVNSRNIHELVPNWKFKNRDTLVAVLMSHCLPSRLKYVHELKMHVAVDIYGRCSDGNLTHSCPGYLAADCKPLNKYIFYLVFENSPCKDYLTEKLFHHAYAKGAIPVIRGPSLQDCDVLPPKSFLHVNNYETPEKLAEEMIRISNDEQELMSYHAWRNDFEVLNEHGYFGTKSYHLCRLCEAMNYNDENESIYDINRLKSFLDPNEACVVP